VLISTSSIRSSDNTRIVFDKIGQGPAILLLHGGSGGQTRRSWHQAGYVDRLKIDFTVITMDIRGHGQSDKPTEPDFYTIDKLCQDVLAVADACQVEQFVLWGFSYGGNIGRYLASRSNRVTKLIIIGIPFGPAASGDFRQFILEFKAHWTPLVEAYLHESLDFASLSSEDQEIWQQLDVPVTLAWLKAMLEWGQNDPSNLRCPTLWLAGTENTGTIASMKAYENMLKDTNMRTFVVEGLNHPQEFEEIALVFPTMLAFTKNEEPQDQTDEASI
jgi:pimeloyl-ACP methyl ester carboxylesterase